MLAYKEIDTLPKQVSVFYTMTSLLKWQFLLDEASWKAVPAFMRPSVQQLTTPHAAWVDRIPWPRVRKYLIEHPSITLDDFAIVYSTNFNIKWPYDPQHCAVPAGVGDDGGQIIAINPVFEEHVKDIKNWIVTNAFRVKFPAMAELIDLDTKPG